MTKNEARKLFRIRRKAFSDQEVNAKSEEILRWIKSFNLNDVEVFHIFLPIEKNNEINTYPIIDYLFEQNKRVVVPIVEGTELLNAEIKPDFSTTLKAFDIPEPIDYRLIASREIEAVFTPLFVVDLQGNRVGYGGGYYDRFFAAADSDFLKIGLSYFEPIEKIEDIHLGDVPLDLMVSPSGIVSFDALSSKVLK